MVFLNNYSYPQICIMLFSIENWWSLLSRLKSLNNWSLYWSVSWKWYPIPDPNSLIYIPSPSKLLENQINLRSGSYMYLYSIYGSTLPPPFHNYHQCYKMVRACTINHQCYLLLKSVLIRFLWEFFLAGFNRRCSYDQAVFSKFMLRISLCGRPYDIIASWLKAFHCF